MSRSNKPKAVAQSQAGQRYREKSTVSAPFWRRVPLWAHVLGLVIIAAGISLPLYLGLRGFATQSVTSPNSAAPLSVASVGESAPGFVLNDPYGQTYALMPGDGRVHVLVFYMGNF